MSSINPPPIKPNDFEKVALENMHRAVFFQIKTLSLGLICFLLSLILPEKFSIIVAGLGGVSLIFYGVLQIHLTLFQKCPRCKHAINPLDRHCKHCGINLHPQTEGEDWM